MGEMKKIVMDDYPVEKLPEEMRRGLESGQVVRVTIETVEREAAATPESLISFFGAGKGCYSEEEAVGFIRRLRDE
jgi:hypothetical protein